MHSFCFAHRILHFTFALHLSPSNVEKCHGIVQHYLLKIPLRIISKNLMTVQTCELSFLLFYQNPRLFPLYNTGNPQLSTIIGTDDSVAKQCGHKLKSYITLPTYNGSSSIFSCGSLSKSPVVVKRHVTWQWPLTSCELPYWFFLV